MAGHSSTGELHSSCCEVTTAAVVFAVAVVVVVGVVSCSVAGRFSAIFFDGVVVVASAVAVAVFVADDGVPS